MALDFTNDFWKELDILHKNGLTTAVVKNDQSYPSLPLPNRVREIIKGDEILRLIEDTIIHIVNDIAHDNLPYLYYRCRRSWDNVSYNPNVGLVVNSDSQHTYTCFNKRSHHKFSMFVKMLSLIYKLIQNEEIATKRDIYYNYPELFGSQAYIDGIIDDISCMLNVPRHYLNVIATSKGCVTGDLTFYIKDDVFNCLGSTVGVMIPNNIHEIGNITTKEAKFVLVVEKDATFQRLLDAKITTFLPCIMGKGFPDVNTRMMVKAMWDTLKIPIFTLVDADPHGIEIMCVYRFGSLSLAYDSANLAVPAIKWIGVLPSDVKRLSINEENLITLTEKDKLKCKDILNRPYIKANSKLKDEVLFMLEFGKKAEIQTLSHISQSYLHNVYLPSKVKLGGWI